MPNINKKLIIGSVVLLVLIAGALILVPILLPQKEVVNPNIGDLTPEQYDALIKRLSGDVQPGEVAGSKSLTTTDYDNINKQMSAKNTGPTISPEKRAQILKSMTAK